MLSLAYSAGTEVKIFIGRERVKFSMSDQPLVAALDFGLASGQRGVGFQPSMPIPGSDKIIRNGDCKISH